MVKGTVTALGAKTMAEAMAPAKVSCALGSLRFSTEFEMKRA